MNTGQMEAELVRDSILHLSGELDLAQGGPPIPNVEAEKSKRRSLYFECFPEPGGNSQFAEMFDPATPLECYHRTSTIIPQQALALSNSKLSAERSRIIAQRITEKLPSECPCDETAFVTAAYEQVLARLPSGDEIEACRDFLAKQSAEAESGVARASLVRVLINHNDFVTIR
jgi:hypothetical protein